MNDWQDKMGSRWSEWRGRWGLAEQLPTLFVLVFLLLFGLLALGLYWGREPSRLRLEETVDGQSGSEQALARALVQVGGTLTHKPGGYLRNDLLPPGVLLDNVPAWELGVLQQVRDLTRALHWHAAGSERPRVEDPDLNEAEQAFNTDPDSWFMPSAEHELNRASQALQQYTRRLAQDSGSRPSLREDQLVYWMAEVNGRLEQLSARLNAALPAYSAPVTAPITDGGQVRWPETPWWQIDDVLYEARGSAWALLHLLRAAEVEFAGPLADRHAELSLRAAIHELEATQQAMWSPVVLNGSGFGLFANHSLVMANYLSRARGDLADVQALLLGRAASL